MVPHCIAASLVEDGELTHNRTYSTAPAVNWPGTTRRLQCLRIPILGLSMLLSSLSLDLPRWNGQMRNSLIMNKDRDFSVSRFPNLDLPIHKFHSLKARDGLLTAQRLFQLSPPSRS